MRLGLRGPFFHLTRKHNRINPTDRYDMNNNVRKGVIKDGWWLTHQSGGCFTHGSLYVLDQL